jgi:hypothetical protein
MKNLFYARINGELKENGRATRQTFGRIPPLAGFAGLLAALWWLGSLGPEAMLGLVVFGAIWGGDKGPGAGGRGSDEPLPHWWWKMLEELKRMLEPAPEPEGLPPFHLPELPPIELETERWPTTATRPMQTDRALKALEREIRRRFGDPKKAGEEFLSSLLRPTREPTFSERLEQLASQPEPREPTFTERLEELARQPGPREPTFSERLEQLAREDAVRASGFRTEGERRRDERQRAARRRPSKKEPSAVERLLAQVEAERRSPSQQPTFGESVEIPSDVPPEAGPTPMRVPEHPDFKALLFERVKGIDDPRKLARDILLASPLDQYLKAGKKADKFTKRMLNEGIIKSGETDGVYNALEHFIAAYTITREFGSPELTWQLGVLNELIISPIAGWLGGRTKEAIARDTEIDFYHNQLGIEEAAKSAGKEVPLYKLVRRLAQEGKFRY